MWGPTPEPPDISPNEEWIEFGGYIAVTASEAVRDALRVFGDAEDAFASAVGEYRRSNAGAKVEAEDPGAAMHEARQAVT